MSFSRTAGYLPARGIPLRFSRHAFRHLHASTNNAAATASARKGRIKATVVDQEVEEAASRSQAEASSIQYDRAALNKLNGEELRALDLLSQLGIAASLPNKRSEKRAKRKVAVFDLDDLPSSRLDMQGNALKPLGAYDPVTGLSSSRGGADTSEVIVANDDDWTKPRDPGPDFFAAVAAKKIPDSMLSRVIWRYWQMFPGCIVLTRVGKFYESYYEPALTVSELLGTKLIHKRYKSDKAAEPRYFPFTGFPFDQFDKFVKVLVHDHRQTVVIVEEYPGDRSVDQEHIPRRVGRVLTPGTLIDESWVDGAESQYLLAIAVGAASVDGGMENGTLPLSLAYSDISTGEFFSKDTTLAHIEDELARIAPREIVLDESLKELWNACIEPTSENENSVISLLALLRVLGVHISFADARNPPLLEGVQFVPTPIPAMPTLENLSISILRHHLQYALRECMPALAEPNREYDTDLMQIDAATLHALEIRHALRPGGLVNQSLLGKMDMSRPYATPYSVRGTLLSVLNRTVTPSGHRLLIRNLTAPSTNLPLINKRLELVQAFVDREDLRSDLRDMIKGIGDIMRVIQRFKSRRGEGEDLWAVNLWIGSVDKIIHRIKRELKREKGELAGKVRLQELVDDFEPLQHISQRIEASFDVGAVLRVDEEEQQEEGDGEGEESIANVVDQGVPGKGKTKDEKRLWIKPGYSPTLKRLFAEREKLFDRQRELQEELRTKYGSKTLILTTKMRYGLVVEAKKTESAKILADSRFELINETKSHRIFAYNPWTAIGARREKLLVALTVEQNYALQDLRQMVLEAAIQVQRNADLINEMDVAMGFALVATDLNYVRPFLNTGTDLKIVNGRHPSVESGLLSSSRLFTPNSTQMTKGSHLHIITGPNQGGKSTLLRQTAVISILAQAGSFVPADHAEIGLVDKVFSRIGARDDLFRDRSTFMLEMVETAAILKHATERSLVIMDEIGRGTTLQAGVSIAYATLNHILEHIKCRTLFATHYHELAKMLTDDEGKVREGVEFWCTDINQVDGAFSYSYKLKPGVNHSSHAIKAARLAGMPESFLRVAQDTLTELQTKHDDTPA